MSKHTPGPWNYFPKLSGSENHKGFHIVAPKYTVGDCIPVDGDGIRGEANARLIAAAPDLLHACRLIIENAPLAADWLERNDIGAYKQVKAAITKATGHD